jgi:hypothetical protein
MNTLNWRRILVVSGDDIDVYWNHEVKTLLDREGTNIPLKIETFGKNVLLYERTI